MRYKEIAKHLDEVRMSPKFLQRTATGVSGARTGLEFEMLIPESFYMTLEGATNTSESDDQRTYNDLSTIIDFFDQNYSNSRRNLNNLEEAILDDYRTWIYEKIDDLWSSEGYEFAKSWIDSRRDRLDIPHKDEDHVTREEFDDFVNEQFNGGPYFDDIYNDFAEYCQDNADISEFLSESGLIWMSDVRSRYPDIVYWPGVSGSDDYSIETIRAIARHFRSSTGIPIAYSDRYHGASKTTGAYRLEPDSSLGGEDNDYGLEFISPDGGLPLEVMIDHIDRVANWANQVGAYTNSSTGLHMNVSVPEINFQKLDYIKLVLLLGDQHILETFNRESNTYCRSSFSALKYQAREFPDKVESILQSLKYRLNQVASDALYAGLNKHISIYRRSNYIEFRSPGNDWLSMYNSDPNIIRNTLYRFVVVLSIACDENAYRQEYEKKLYKLLETYGNSDTIKFFVRYSSGLIPRSALTSFVRQSQRARASEKQSKSAPTDTNPALGYSTNTDLLNNN